MIALLSTSDTDLLSARASGAAYRWANPSRIEISDVATLIVDADIVIVRILGGYPAWREGIDAVLASGKPVLLLGGEMVADPDLMERSTAPIGVVRQAHQYLAQGGAANVMQLANFLSDSLLMTGLGFLPPENLASWGVLSRAAWSETDGSTKDSDINERYDEIPTVAIIYYRAHHLAGNTQFVAALAGAIEEAGARALPVYCASLRSAEPDLVETLRAADAIIVTVQAAGSATPAAVGAGGDDDEWDVSVLAGLDVPLLQGLCVTSSRQAWLTNDDGLSPLDAATQIAVPEFDGRIITIPFSFKEIDDDGLIAYVPDIERTSRMANMAVKHASLAHIPVSERKIALVLSAYPTKHSRIGNAVGLDTPVSAVRLVAALAAAGYDVGDALPTDGDEFIHMLIAAGGQDPNWLTDAAMTSNTARVSAQEYRRYFDTLEPTLAQSIIDQWGPPPGELFVDRQNNPDGDIVFACVTSGNIVVMIQPPRGFGERPVSIYHDPDLAPSHHYLACYYWLREIVGVDAMVHLGKHGNLEWLPGKTAALSAGCAADAAVGDVPVVYPFLVNDPGEGTQAKRRMHATIVDHLVPPMTRAESYGDIARLEQLLDEHAQIAAMDPEKLPAIRSQIWTLIQAAKLDHDLGLTDGRPHDSEFDDFLLHVDGWICEVKDAQIRDGLHILGDAPHGEQRIGLLLAILQARQMWGGRADALPGLREALGYREGSDDRRSADDVEARARTLVSAMEEADWDLSALPDGERDEVRDVLAFGATEVVPRLADTALEIPRIVHALNGGYVPAGPSGSPLRGLVNVLPTGRNFYSVDPRAIPSSLAWETGQAMAASLIERHRTDAGSYPTSVGLSMWGTAAMRTSGDDIAEVFALLGVKPQWDQASRRVRSVDPIPLSELGRPRIDVTLRISGFFRDAFPYVVDMIDDAIVEVAHLDEPADSNYVRAHYLSDLADHGDERRATTRIFGSKPGTYGAGLLELMDSHDWRGDTDLAEVYAAWGGFAYGRGLAGRAARDEMETTYRRIAVAAHNTDTLEHDIADSDDYFQYHGGMIAMVRSLTGTSPRAYIGDSTKPDAVRTRSLTEATSRVFRSRVVNPRWIDAMKRHGYKGAFELAATVDYLFGYDATANVMADWMYEKLTDSYVRDEATREFFMKSNPWALHGISERLLEAAQRGMWVEPDPGTLNLLRETYLEMEGDIEDR